MTPSLPHDRPASSSSESPRPATTSWSVGWALTAVTCTILVVGVAIIRQLSDGPDSGTIEEIPTTVTVEQEAPSRLVLRPESPDSVSIPSLREGIPASWEQDATSEESFILPAYR